jgi:hypothetical protein
MNQADHETVPPGEDHAIERVVDLVLDTMRSDYAAHAPVLRGQHPKPHGSVRAQLEIGLGAPADLRHGIFAEPRTYDAWIRFSASAAPPRSDARRDAHGMSIKVLGVESEHFPGGVGTQDFTLVNHPVFFCRDAIDYAEFAAAVAPEGTMLHGPAAAMRLLAFYLPPNPAYWRIRDSLNLWRTVHREVTNPLQIRYWSQTPFALGPHAVKYSAIPRHPTPRRRRPPPGEDRLREAMARTLRSTDVTFDLAVQRQLDRDKMPVEDATVEWKERLSPFRKVATIRIPAQDFTSREQSRDGEDLHFSPWNTLPEHRPLGGINRLRRAVYERGAAERTA